MKKLVLVLMVLGLALPSLADLIGANDDVEVRLAPYNYVRDNLDPFGLMAKSGSFFLVEFTLGSDAVTNATLHLDNQYLADSSHEIGFKSLEYDFNDSTIDFATASSFSGSPDIAGTITGVQAIGIYTVDITSWYNANLGKTMTIQGNLISGSGSAPIFDDSEGTLGGTAPAIVTVPEPATLLLLSAGLGALIRRKR